MDAEPTPSPAAKGFLREFVTTELPDLGPRARQGRYTTLQIEERLDRILAEFNVPARSHPLLHAAALLWHDYLDESHTLSQDIRSIDGSFLHGIMHRREPDYGNARYWFNRVGRHPASPLIGRAVHAALTGDGDSPLAERLAPGGNWDPFAFIDACEESEGAPAGDSFQKRLRQVQAIEFEQLVRHLLD